MVGGRVHQKRVTVEVSGPKSMFSETVKQRVNFNLTWRDFLRDIVDRKKLAGCKITTVGGTWRNAVSLDSAIKDFVQLKFARKMDCYRVRVMKMMKKSRGPVKGADSNQVVYTIEDDEDGGVVGSVGEDAGSPVTPGSADDSQVVDDQHQIGGGFVESVSGGTLVEDAASLATTEAAASDSCSDGGQVVDDQHLIGGGFVESVPGPLVEDAASASDSVSDGGEVVDDQQPGSSRDLYEQIAQDRASMPPPPPAGSILENNFSIKEEMVDVAHVKNEIPDAESTIGFLRANGVTIDNVKAQVEERLEEFRNPFLLRLKEELEELRDPGNPLWQNVVGKAPMCAHLLAELFAD